ncbi:hypothetical protein QP168_10490, partial [Aerococcus urinae]|uniref:hypothetical protein n=1 Tax=Aerococcus urinae TaxID=1376 RepID=UPI00254EABBE
SSHSSLASVTPPSERSRKMPVLSREIFATTPYKSDRCILVDECCFNGVAALYGVNLCSHAD